MALITLLLYLVGLIVFGIMGLIIFLYFLDWKRCKYYRDRGVPYIEANYGRLLKLLFGKLSLVDAELLIYQDALELSSPIVGASDTLGQLYLIMDLDLTRNIYVKDADHFIDRRQFATQNGDVLTKKMLISLEGDHWKGMRSKLSPTFTTGKIRRMFSIFEKSSIQMCEFLEKIVGTSGKDVDICESFSKYTIDVIASCAFGLDSNTFESGPGKMTKFEEMALRFRFNIKLTVFIKFFIVALAPKLAEFLGIQAFDVEPQKYFRKVITEVMEHRRKTGQRQNDFLQLMMDTQEGLLKQEEDSKETIEVMTGTTDTKVGDGTGNNFMKSSQNLKIDDDDIISNCVLFLIGGVDTTQSLLIFAAYQLALEPECQEKLRKEVNESVEANNGKLTYEAVHGMSYLDMFINETLRYYPPAARTERLCTKDYKLPIENGPVIEKGTIVGLPVIGMQRNPDVYENPHKFDPERFLPERKHPNPYAFAPFGHGIRNCIGMRFALTEVKTVLATLVRNFKLEPCSKTDIPIQYASTTSLKPKNGMHLNIRPICEE